MQTIKMSKQGHHKAEMERWDTVMGEQRGEDTSYNQPFRLREKIHTGSLKIKQAHGQAVPVKQHPEYILSVQIAKEREQQRAVEGNFRREEPETNPAASSSSQWDGWWTSSWWDKTAFGQFLECLWRAAKGRESEHTVTHKAHFSRSTSHLSFVPWQCVS